MNFKQLREEWYSSINASYRPGERTPIYLNPSRKEVHQLQRENMETINLILSGDDVYMFAGVLHDTVLKSLSLRVGDDFIALSCEGMEGSVINNVLITITTKSGKWKNSERAKAKVLNHPWMKRYMDEDVYVEDYDVYAPLNEGFHKHLKIGGSITEILKNPSPYEIRKALNSNRYTNVGLIDLKLVSDGKDVYIWDGWTTSHSDIMKTIDSKITIQAEFMYDLRSRSVEEVFGVMIWFKECLDGRSANKEEKKDLIHMLKDLGFKTSKLLSESTVSDIKKYVLDHQIRLCLISPTIISNDLANIMRLFKTS